jgi:hypothetical protein
MANKLTNLLHEGKIDKYEFDTYLMYGADDLGRDYLKNMLNAIVLEEPIIGKPIEYGKAEGRRSVWRQIKLIIDKINYLMEGNQDVNHGNNSGNLSSTNPDLRPLYEFHPPANGQRT